MKKLLKICGIIVGILIVLIAGLLVAAKVIITPERVRQAVMPIATDALHRPVSIGEIDVRLLSGITIRDVTVQMRERQENFVAAEALVLRYQLWPLLQKKVVIDEATLKRPQVRIIRNTDGSFNFSDLIEKPPEEKGGQPAEAPPATGEADGGAAIDLLVSKVSLTDGELVFTDHVAGPQPFSYQLSGLAVSAKDISLEKNFPFSIEARLNDAPISVSGTASPASRQIDARLKLSDFNVTDFKPYFKDHLPGQLAAMKVNADLTVTGGGKAIQTEGSIKIHGIDLVLASMPDAPFQKAHLALEYDVAVDMSDEKIDIRRASADINGIPLDVKGTVSQYGSGPRVNVDLSIADADMAAVMNAVPGALVESVVRPNPAGALTAAINLNMSLQDSEKYVKTAGEVQMRQLDMTFAKLPDAPLRNFGVALDYDVYVDMAAETIDIRNAAADLNGIPVKAKGSVTRYATSPRLDVGVSIPKTGFARIFGAIPEGLRKPVSDMDPAGDLEIELLLAGSAEAPAELLKSGKLVLDKIQATTAGLRPQLDGVIQLSTQRVATKGLQLTLGEDRAVVDAEVSDYLKRPIRVNHTVSAQKLDLDRLLAAVGGGEPKKSGKEASSDNGKGRKPGKADKSEPVGPFDLPLVVNGQLLVDEATYKGLPVRNFRMEYELKDNIFKVKEIRAHAAGGEVSLDARVDLTKPGLAYDLGARIDSIQFNPLLSALYSPIANTFFGTAFLDARFNGTGTRLPDIQKTLNMQTQGRITDGKIAGTGVGGGLASGLAGFLNIPQLRELDFDVLKGTLDVDEGKIKVDTEYLSKDVTMTPKGTIGLDGTVKLSLNLRLAPDLTRKLDQDTLVARLLQDEKGWTRVPVELSGSLIKPHFSFDQALIQEQLKQKATDELKRKLQDELLDKLGPKEKKGEQPAKPPAEKMLEDAFREIFKQ